MAQVSVVIIVKNEASNIVACIESAKKLSDDIIVIDSGSNDGSISLAANEGAKVRSISWTNYGNARNAGARLASYDWIFAIDADERITDKLSSCIAAIDLSAINKIYGFKRLNFFGNEKIIHGPLGHDRVFRLYNRRQAAWNDVQVHEKLTGKAVTYCMLPAEAEHYGNKNPDHYLQKKIEYASLWAIKQQQLGKRPGLALRLSSTVMSFIKAYFIQSGFLDMRYGLRLAKINAFYTWYKYGLLKKLSEQDKVGKYNAATEDQRLSNSKVSKVPAVSEV